MAASDDETGHDGGGGGGATAPDALLGKVIAGRYEVVGHLGAGGMGSVYKAKQLSMDRFVALKLLHQHYSTNEQAVARFNREMKVTAKIEHPNTIRVYDYGRAEDGRLFLAVEFLSGRTLSHDLRRGEPMASERLVHIGVQIGKALVAAHGDGVVHRDLKPDNVMLLDRYGERDFVKVLDFGIARFLDEETARTQLTAEGAVVGTPAYMSPEQATGAGVDHRTDLYSFGVMLFEMATGQVPFDAPTTISLMVKHVQDAPPRPSEIAPGLVPEPIEALILQMLEKAPERRPKSAAEVVRRLEQALTPSGHMLAADTKVNAMTLDAPVEGGAALSGMTATSTVARPAEGGRSRRGLVIAAVVGALLIVGVVVALAVGGGGGGGEPVAATETSASEVDAGSSEPTDAGTAAGSATNRGAVAGGEPDVVAAAASDAGAEAGADALAEAGADAEAGPDAVAAAVAGSDAGAESDAVTVAEAGADAIVGEGPDAEALEADAVRRRYEAAAVAAGEVLAPTDCRTDDAVLMATLRRATELLEGARIGAPRERDKQAVALLEEASARGQDAAEYWALASRARLMSGGTPASALEAASRAIALCEAYAVGHNALGTAHLMVGSAADAERAYSRAIALAPRYVSPRFNRGILRLRAGDHAAAVAAFTAVLDVEPDNKSARLLRGQAHTALKQNDEAIADLMAAIDPNAKDPAPWLLLGQALTQSGDKERATVAFCKAKDLGAEAAAPFCP